MQPKNYINPKIKIAIIGGTSFIGQKLLSLLPKKKFIRHEIKKKIFIVCNFEKKTFLNISRKLIKKGLSKDQILYLHF